MVIGLNWLSLLSDSNLRLELLLNGFFSGLSRNSSKGIPWGVFLMEVVVVPVSRVPRGLINFPVSEGFQGFSFSFSPIAFIPDIVSGILKVF